MNHANPHESAAAAQQADTLATLEDMGLTTKRLALALGFTPQHAGTIKSGARLLLAHEVGILLRTAALPAAGREGLAALVVGGSDLILVDVVGRAEGDATPMDELAGSMHGLAATMALYHNAGAQGVIDQGDAKGIRAKTEAVIAGLMSAVHHIEAHAAIRQQARPVTRIAARHPRLAH